MPSSSTPSSASAISNDSPTVLASPAPSTSSSPDLTVLPDFNKQKQTTELKTLV